MHGTIDGNVVIISEISLNDILDKGCEVLALDRSHCKIIVNINL
ncbi:hypothetical protein J6TS2_12730 [Heyndrickxia sporothermodurans]|nr:hypothetical protein J6TS2_12730 [Heyndrickxia sporothermodurans]